MARFIAKNQLDPTGNDQLDAMVANATGSDEGPANILDFPDLMGGSNTLVPMDEDAFQQTVRNECMRAVQWIEDQISNIRQKTDVYYQGGTTQKAEAGRSQVVVTQVRDTIQGILPSIGRIFTQSDVVGEFSSDDEEDEPLCQQMTLFCNSIFNKYGGYKALIMSTTNALVSRIGVVRVDLSRVEVANHTIARDMGESDIEELQEDIKSGLIQITEASPVNPMTLTQSVVMTRKSFRNKWSIDPLPPEQFIIDSNATCIEDARLVGVRKNMYIYEAMEELGLSYEELAPLTWDDASMLQQERQTRVHYDQNTYNDNWATDPTAKRILITECWMRVDADGDGVAELRHLICGGINYQIFVDEVAHFVPLAVFITDLQPNVFFPIALAESLIQDQDSMTAVTRSILDNVALVNQPRTEANESMVNLEDLKNTEIGAIIRVKQVGQINELATPFAAGQTLPVLQYLQANSEQRSGVTKISQGVDPNALQSVSRAAAGAMVTGADARIEMMARNIAETGMKELFLCILRVAMYELKGKQSIKVPEGYKSIDTSKWHDQLSININVGLGNGRIEEKQMVLQNVLMVQQAIIEKAGLVNPMCTWENVRNTLKTQMRLSGIKNIQDYFPFAPPEAIQQFNQQQQQAAAAAAQAQQGQAPDVVGAAKVKGEVDMQINQQKIQAQTVADIQKMQAEQAKTMAELTQKHNAEMASLRAEMVSKMTIAGWEVDQRRDAANQKYAVDATKVQLDAQTAKEVAKVNATNQPKAP